MSELQYRILARVISLSSLLTDCNEIICEIDVFCLIYIFMVIIHANFSIFNGLNGYSCVISIVKCQVILQKRYFFLFYIDLLTALISGKCCLMVEYNSALNKKRCLKLPFDSVYKSKTLSNGSI
jgi:hypothetical protein